MVNAPLVSPPELASLVLGAMGPARHLVLLLDYDGTLVPIAMRPHLAKADPDLPVLLDRLGSHPRVSVGVVSGRALEDLKSVLGGTGRFFLFAEHGGVGAWPDGRVSPLLEEQSGEDLEQVRRRLKDIVWPEGIWVEEKQFALALHTRGAPRAGIPPAHAAFRNAVRELDSSQRLDVVEGKEILEVRPSGLEKGRVVEWLRYRLADVSPVLVAIGDDRTDEDAFRRLGPRDFAIRVGPPGPETAALFCLPDPFAVRSFLHGVSAGLS